MIPWARPKLFGDEIRLISKAIKSTFISSGDFLSLCEKKLSFIHDGDCLCVANGTAALQLALQTLKISTGDEVLVPGWCFAAAANMVLACGATPVYVDITDDTWLMDASKIEQYITPKTKAIIPVHTYGNVCDMPKIREIADEHGLFVIEDCAESFFSRIDHKLCGTFSDIASFSFQATKIITCGEGGMILINNLPNDHSSRARLIYSHGMDRSYRHYWHHLIGYNYRLTNIQAAMLYAQLDHIDEIILRRRHIYERYNLAMFLVRPGQKQKINDNVNPVIWTLGIRVDSDKRDDLINKLKADGIETRPGFYAFSEQPLYNTKALPISSMVAKEVICLPYYYDLQDDQIDYICDKLKKHLGEANGR